MEKNREKEIKTCTQCEKAFVELFDAYSNDCPTCSIDHDGVLVRTEGGWVWHY